MIKYLLHKNVQNEDLKNIIDIKSIYWPYPLQSQLEWIENNINDEDVHAFLIGEDRNVEAYLNMIAITFEVNKKKYEGFGIGNVCSSKKGSGAILMQEMRKYFIEKDKVGILFCKSELISYYIKYGWELIPYEKIITKDINENIFTMILNYRDVVDSLDYSGKIF